MRHLCEPLMQHFAALSGWWDRIMPMPRRRRSSGGASPASDRGKLHHRWRIRWLTRNYDIHRTCEREFYRMLLSLLRPFMLLAFSFFPSSFSLSLFSSSSFIVSFNIYFFSINLYDFPTYVITQPEPLRKAKDDRKRKRMRQTLKEYSSRVVFMLVRSRFILFFPIPKNPRAE